MPVDGYLRRRMTLLTRSLIAACLALVLALGSSSQASAHTLRLGTAEKKARKLMRAVKYEVIREGIPVADYGIEGCRRRNEHVVVCEGYLESGYGELCDIRLVIKVNGRFDYYGLSCSFG